MSTNDRLAVLRAIKELGGFSAARLRALLPHVDELCVGPGDELAREGRLCHQLVIVASGFLETCRQGRAVNLGPGDTFGWCAMRDRGLNEGGLSALSPAHLLVMSHHQFRAVAALND